MIGEAEPHKLELAMTSHRSIAFVGILALFSAAGCAANETRKADAFETIDAYVIDSQAGSVANIAVGMTELQIRESGWPYKTRMQNLEGDVYKTYDVSLADDVVLNCTLDLGNTLYRIETSSIKVRDEHGLGVGSKLIELRRAYPDGRFIKGNAEGRHANFLTGARLVFYFDVNDLDSACFEGIGNCLVDENMMAEMVAIGRYSPE